KRNSWSDGALRLETLYIGAPQSALRIRIYDKAREQGQEGNWWRVEAQMRGEWVKSINGEFRDEKGGNFNIKPFLMDPFEGLSIKVPDLQKDGVTLQEKALIHYLVTFPESWNELSKPSRLKYKKILARMESNEEIDLSKLFAKKRNDIMYDVQKWLRIAKKNDVIQA
ncbi:replication initiation factor domain-containing protein, partial [Haloferula chungangensis]